MPAAAGGGWRQAALASLQALSSDAPTHCPFLPSLLQSTLFNALCENAKAQAANFPFCTIEPNVGIVAVPDDRLDLLWCALACVCCVSAVYPLCGVLCVCVCAMVLRSCGGRNAQCMCFMWHDASAALISLAALSALHGWSAAAKCPAV